MNVDKNPYFEQQKICPVCQNKFTVTRVRSSACFVVARDTDFYVKYRDINPLLYSIWVCPNCQYANSDRDFNEPLRPAELERLKKGLALLRSEEPDFSGERTPQVGLRSLELAIRTAQIRQAPAIVQAGLFLRAAWICRELGKTETEMKYIEQAKNLYQQSFEKEWGRQTAKMSDCRIMYLIGELNRRLGNYEEAVKWFSRTAVHKAIKNEPEINRLVRDQWEIAREAYKKQQSGKLQEQGPTEGEGGKARESTESKKDPESIGDGKTGILQPKSRGSKVKMFLSLYTDQVEWLKTTANRCYDRHKVFMEKETVARAILDAVMEAFPEVDDFKSEEELKNIVLRKLVD